MALKAGDDVMINGQRVTLKRQILVLNNTWEVSPKVDGHRFWNTVAMSPAEGPRPEPPKRVMVSPFGGARDL